MIDAALSLKNKNVSKRRSVKFYLPTEEITHSARWLINGFPATILFWTAEEWACLTDQPHDAQQVANGTWCTLRID